MSEVVAETDFGNASDLGWQKRLHSGSPGRELPFLDMEQNINNERNNISRGIGDKTFPVDYFGQ